MSFILHLSSAFVLVMLIAPAHESPVQKTKKVTNDFDTAIARLKKKGVPVSDLEEGWDKLGHGGDCKSACVEIWNNIYNRADGAGVSSELKVKTDTPGARVKIQTLGQRERKEPPRTLKKQTTCTEKIPIGRYYIWAERDGRPTSDDDLIFSVVEKKEEVDLKERQR
jgi:hypothetical protein